MLAAALPHYDLDVASVRLITNATNCVFRLDTADSTYAARVGIGGEVAHAVETVACETDWLAALAAESGPAVPQPVPTRTGSRFITVEAPGVPDARNVVVFSWLRGRPLMERLDTEPIRSHGALAARLHAHGRDHRPPYPESLARYDRVYPFRSPFVLFDADHPLVPPSRRAVFAEAAARVEAGIGILRDAEPPRIVHGDLHAWNVMVHRRVLTPFDFEDLMWGWPIQDVATAIYYLQDRPEFADWLGAFRDGYEAVAPWPERYRGELTTFILGRHLVLANDLLIVPEWRDDAAVYLERFERRMRRLLDG